VSKAKPEKEYASTHDLIIDLKNSKEKQGLSLAQVKDMLADIGFYPGKSTLQRVFEKGSEDKNFNYETTLRPLMRVLLKNDSPEDKTALYEDALAYKAEKIESLLKQIDAIKEDHADRCKGCEERILLLKAQIELKDRRMDEQAQRIDRLIDRVNLLTDRNNELMDLLLKRE